MTWKGALENTKYHALWYGNAKYDKQQVHAEIGLNTNKANPDRTAKAYKWQASYGGIDVASGSEATLAEAKESADIALFDHTH